MNLLQTHSLEENSPLILREGKKFREYALWLQQYMPSAFFQELKEETFCLIVHNLMGFHLQDYFSPIYFTDMSITLCLDDARADMRILKSYSMYGIKHYHCYISDAIFPYGDGGRKLRIAIIRFTQMQSATSPSLPSSRKKTLREMLHRSHSNLKEEEIQVIERDLTHHFLETVSEQSLEAAFRMFFRAKTRDNCQYEIGYHEDWKEKQLPSFEIVLAWRNVSKYNFLYHLAQMVYRHDLNMQQVNATYINPYQRESVLIMIIGLHGREGQAAWEVADVTDFLQELVTMKFFPQDDLIASTFVENGWIRGNLANFLRTLIPFIHQALVTVDENLYSYENIQEAICRHPELTVLLCQVFEHKFHPKKHNLRKYEEQKEEFFTSVHKLDTGNEAYDQRRKQVLLQGMNLIEYALKTNFYRNNKPAISFRLDPNYLDKIPIERKEIFPELPFAIFFIRGMHFFGFQIRFKDLSRGGLRTIFPQDIEKACTERNYVFKECYSLAYTQQKKNKDIPEGGAKGVIFLEPLVQWEAESAILRKEMCSAQISQEEIQSRLKLFHREQKEEFLCYAQRAFVTSLLTIVNATEEGKISAKDIVDYWQKPEYIYLGPDENMRPQTIQWIARHSKRFKYKPGISVISSKPDFGINHKEYGVTSLGVHVYVEEFLSYLGIDPQKQPFTVKISGGPDGDVAGNQILNLYKYYPKTARILSLIDISGTIYDPKGLDLSALATLFEEGKPIRFYPREKLSSGGFLLDCKVKRRESTYVQETLCWKKEGNLLQEKWMSGSEMNSLLRKNVHQTVTDLFIPAGGRPRTLHSGNYREFLDDRGAPTAKVIVEGANLYLTDRAREALQQLGVLIIKDSSANKGGVIASSFEVLLGLVLSEEEFVKEKELLVAEVLEIIRNFSQKEARLLIQTHQKDQRFLTEISEEISSRINQFTDQLLSYLEKIPISSEEHSTLFSCFLDYLPSHLQENYRERAIEKIPDSHKRAIIACSLASQLVYRKGLDWQPTIVDILPLILSPQGT